MSHAFRTVGVLAGVLLAGGCVYTLGEVVPERDALVDDRILGDWRTDDEKVVARISRSGPTSYRILYLGDEDDAPGEFEARLGRIGARSIIELWTGTDGSAPFLAAPVRLPLFYDLMGDSAVTWVYDESRMREALASRSVRLASQRIDDADILTDTGRVLREGLTRLLGRAGALNEYETWHRLAPGAFDARAYRDAEPCFEPSVWHEADQLFRRDKHWRGGDVASSVDLGGGRTLWLFGDSWIDSTGQGRRDGSARMVSNSIALQRGADPATASIAFHWGRDSAGAPAAFFPDRSPTDRLWPGSGVRIGDQLLLFFVRSFTRPSEPLGFSIGGWSAALVENPDADPGAWRVRWLESPPNPLGVTPGFAGVMLRDRHVYAFGSASLARSHPIFLASWPLESAARGDLRAPMWWDESNNEWLGDASRAPRAPLFDGGQAELSIHFDSVANRWISVQSVGFGPADIAVRSARMLGARWSEPRVVFRPSEYHKPKIMIYAAKAHPHLAGADLVVTYVTNSFDFQEHRIDDALYYPRFVRFTRCR